MHFCHQHHLQPLPTSEDTILRYMAYCYSRKLSAATIQVYISAVAYLQAINGLPAPDVATYRIKLAIRAIKDLGPAPTKCAPVTFQLLQYIVGNVVQGDNGKLFAAMLSLGFFGALRGAEYAAVHIQNGVLLAPRLQDIQFVVYDGVYGLLYTIHKSKTVSVPITIAIGCSGHVICAVCMMTEYLQSKPASLLHPQSYLFTFKDGRPVTKAHLNSVIKQQIQSLNLDCSNYSTHSLRAGAAMTANQLGFNEDDIKQLGHWKSLAYQSYIRQSYGHRLQFSKRLVQQPL